MKVCRRILAGLALLLGTSGLLLRLAGGVGVWVVVIDSFACFWIALSQVCLLSHARSWWRRSAGTSKVIGPSSSS
jgi:hypothetical protein